jgi:hypothetical protein
MLFGFQGMEDQKTFLLRKFVYLTKSFLEVDCCSFILISGVAT